MPERCILEARWISFFQKELIMFLGYVGNKVADSKHAKSVQICTKFLPLVTFLRKGVTETPEAP